MARTNMAILALVLIVACGVSASATADKSADARNGFAIYLLSDTQLTAKDALRLDLDALVLQDHPLLTGLDIASYRWPEHTLVLKPGVAARIPKPASFGIPFVVTVGSKRMYLGAFWASFSSASFPNPVIDTTKVGSDGQCAIERDYPARDGESTVPDPRSNPLISEALATQTTVLYSKAQTDLDRYYPSPDAILSYMKKTADLIAHVKVTGGLDFTWTDEAGVLNSIVHCEVVEPIKGDAAKGQKLDITFTRFEYSREKGWQTEPALFEKGKDYVIFLTRQPGRRYELLDRWVGALLYNAYLVDRLVSYLK